MLFFKGGKVVMKTKKLLAILLTVIMLLAFASCGSKDDSKPAESTSSDEKTSNVEEKTSSGGGEPVPVTFWTLSSRQEGVDPIVQAFNESQTGVKVTAAYYDTDGIKEACKVAASSNTLPNMWFNWGGSLGGFFVENGLTYDLSEYAKKNNWDKTFNAGALNLCTLHGKLSGYPTSYNVIGVYYRKDIFEKYALKVPTTFEEFEEICATLKANGITPISTAGLYGWHVMRFVELLVEHYCGPELHDKLNTFEESWDNENVVKALTKYQEFCQKGYFPDGFVTSDPNDTNMAVFSGKAAMDIQGQWYDGTIVQGEQDINQYSTFAFPSGGTNRMSAFAEMTQFNVNNTEAELEACIQFMDYYNSDTVVEKYAEYYNLPLPKIGSEAPAQYVNVPVMIDTSAKNGTFTITDQAFPAEVADALFNAQAAIANNEMTPKEGAAAIQKAIESYKAK
jgi:raffinose/stachyose/melibiose transport system substrate-binding protein